MKDRARKMLVYTALGAALIYGWYNLLGPGRYGSVETEPEPLVAATLSAAATQVATDSTLDRVADKPWGQDPFRARRKGRVRQDPDTWTVTGIVYNQDAPLAYVNRKAAKVGDTVDNAKVVEISKTSVTLEYQGNQFTISVPRG